MNIIVRSVSCAAACFTLAAAFGVNAEDDTTCKNHYILTYPVTSYAVRSWIATGNLNVPRSYHSATLLSDGRVLVAGGHGRDGATLDSAELYDPFTVSWSTTGNLSAPRSIHTATLLPNGKVLVAGGDLGSDIAGTAELYDPTTGSWTSTGKLNTPRAAFTATLLGTGQVLIAGGVGISDETLTSAELYDPATGKWSFTGELLEGRLLQAATALQDGRVLIVGGWSDDFFQLSISTAELYDPASGTWSSAARLNRSRSFHTATTLQDGKVLVTGGYRDNIARVPGSPGIFYVPTSLDEAELYDPTAATWIPVGNLNAARDSHTATLLPDGDVLIAGGFDWNVRLPVTGTELYGSATAAWVDTGSLASDRRGHTATLLRDGTVLVAGGASGDVSLGSVELNAGPATGVCP